MPLHEAIGRMTAYPPSASACQTGVGFAEGLAADVVVFDPAMIVDLATLTDPYRGATGIGHVFVNGGEVVTGSVVSEAGVLFPLRLIESRRNPIRPGAHAGAVLVPRTRFP